MKFIFKYLYFLLVITSYSCGSSNDVMEFEDYNPHDFYYDKGIVYQIHDYFSWKYLEESRDVYFIYNLNKVDTLYDVFEDTNYFGLNPGQEIEILVHKGDPKINFFSTSGFSTYRDWECF